MEQISGRFQVLVRLRQGGNFCEGATETMGEERIGRTFIIFPLGLFVLYTECYQTQCVLGGANHPKIQRGRRLETEVNPQGLVSLRAGRM